MTQTRLGNARIEFDDMCALPMQRSWRGTFATLMRSDIRQNLGVRSVRCLPGSLIEHCGVDLGGGRPTSAPTAPVFSVSSNCEGSGIGLHHTPVFQEREPLISIQRLAPSGLAAR